MNRTRTFLAVGVVVAGMSSMAPAHAQPAIPPRGAHDFDFLAGEWRVHHRRLTPAGDKWVEFEGTCSHRTLMDGAANIEEHALNAPSGAYRAIGLRSYDPTSGHWAIWWLDGRYPTGPLGPPVKGRFENGIGSFHADYTQDGKTMRGRFLWSDITPTSARWEQSSSSDGGKTWTANWIMEFRREASRPTPAAVDRTGSANFDFLRGDWHVHHRYLRVKGSGRTWVDVDGTASSRELMGGRANLEEHTIEAPDGAYRALALRSYDPKSSQWSIWWLDGRAPHDDLEPPVRGRFEDGVGTFHGTTTANGTPVRVRFVWSRITATSARWEQAYSPDEGKTWESNWTMEFRRAAPLRH